MKQKLSYSTLVAVPLLFLACSLLRPTPQTSSSPTSVATTLLPSTSTPAAEYVPSPVIKLSGNDMVCPSENEAAANFYNQAGSKKDNGDFVKAEELYLKAIELDPEFCDAMDNLGQLLREQNKVDEAISWYQKSLQIVPDNPVAIQNLALAYHLQGKNDEALEEYKKLTEVAPDNPEGYYGLGNVYFNLDQPEKAIPYFETAEKLYSEQGSPYVIDAQYYLGFSHFALQDCLKAREYLEPIYTQLSEDGGINYVLGVCYLTTEPKDEKAAREYILKAQASGIEIPADILEAIKEQ